MTTRRAFLQRTSALGIGAALGLSREDASGASTPRGSSRGVSLAQTVLGPRDVATLGVTLPHEHLADAPDALDRWPKTAGGRPGLIASAVERLKVINAGGISTIVDLTTYDVGRDIRFLEALAHKSGMNLIACTGQRFFPPRSAHVSMPSHSIAGLAEYFIKECEQGIDGTGIKAGVIKIGIVGARPTALEEVGLRAAVRASQATGLPIRIHTDAAHRAAESDARILAEEGVDPTRVSFDHSDDSGELDYFLSLAAGGYRLSMDHVHRGLDPKVKPSFERRVDCIKQLIDAGFARQLFLSCDCELGGALLPKASRDWRENLDPAQGMLFSVRTLVPQLIQRGVSSEHIHTLTVDNPKVFFGKVVAA